MQTGIRFVRDAAAAALGLVVGTALISSASWLLTGRWTAWFGIFRWGWVLVAVGAALLLWVLVKFLFPSRGGSSVPRALGRHMPFPYGVPVAQFSGSFDGVVWAYRGVILGPPPNHGDPQPDIEPSTLEVDLPPRCPICGTDIEEGRFSRLYRWKCVGCGWRKLKRRSYYDLADTAQRFFQGRWRGELAKKGVLR